MPYQQQQAESKRIEVETPNAQREVVHSETVRYPERTGVSGAALAAIVIGVMALAAVIILFVMNQQQQTTNDNLAAAQQPANQQPVVVQQPAPQQPVIVQQPAPAPQAPVVINGQSQPAGGTSSDDSVVQAAVDKKLADDPAFNQLDVTTTVVNGKVTLVGTVKSEAQKAQVERAVRNIKGVKSVDNQLAVG